MKLLRMELWHPESPGMRVIVWRNWWQRWLYPREFATLGEVLASYRSRLPRL